MSEPEKRKVTYPLSKETLQDRIGGYYPTVETLTRRCKERYGSDVLYDSTADCCFRYELTPNPEVKPPETIFFIKI